MVLWCAAAVMAYFVKGLCGFANTLIFTSILAFGNNNINITPVELLLGVPSNLFMAWKWRKTIQLKACLPLIAMVIAGIIPGAFLLKHIDANGVRIAFGFVLIGLGAEMLLRERSQKKARKPAVLTVVIGVLSGLLCGLFGVGALLSAYMGRVMDDTKAFKANLCVVFLAENLFRIILYIMWGIITLQTLKQTAILAPFMALGLLTGMRSAGHLRESTIRRVIIVMLIVSGAALIVNSII